MFRRKADFERLYGMYKRNMSTPGNGWSISSTPSDAKIAISLPMQAERRAARLRGKAGARCRQPGLGNHRAVTHTVLGGQPDTAPDD